jgi:uncharacterized membrane protein SirB2
MKTMDYLAIRAFHETTVALSVTGFFIRGAAGLHGARWVQSRAAKTVPHIVDTALLTSALMLLTILRIDPFAAPWLAAKIAGLLVYIGLGVVALRPGVPKPVRACTWAGALMTAGWIISVAFTKSPLGFLSLL